MGSMICMNKVCRTTTSSEWKEGWSLKSGGFANLCYNCGSAFENLAFCETFHMGDSGWRVCKMCGKHLHCGCIASQHLFEYLDSGGVGCISCTRRLDGHSMRPMQVPADDTNFIQPLHVEKGVDKTNFDKGRLPTVNNIMEISEPGQPFQSQKDENNMSLGKTKQEKVLPVGDVSTCFSNLNQQSIASLFREQDNSKPNQEVKEMYDTTNQPSLDFSLSNPVGCSSPGLSFPGGGVEGREHEKTLPFQQGLRTRHILPKPPKLSPSFGSDSNKELPSQTRIARPLAEGRGGLNQLLPRYWPRITDQELRLLSGDLKSTIVPLFEKVLSASDAGQIGRLVLPKACAEAYFPPINQSDGLPIRIQDIKGKEWTFQFRFWPNNNSRMYVLDGVTPCIQNMQLQAGDTVTFSRIDPGGKLVMGFRKATNSVETQDPQSSHLPDGSGSADTSFTGLTENLNNGGRTSADSVHRHAADDTMELRITWEESQELLRPPPTTQPTILVIEDCEFEEYDEPPVFGKQTIFTSRPSGDQEQWAQCDSCSKRRRLPMHVLLPPKWTCSDNIWDSNRCSCSAPKEIKAKELEAFFRVDKMAKGRVSKTGGRGRDKSPSKRSIKRIKTSQEDELQKSIVAEVETKLFQVAEGENAGEEENEKENEEVIEKENKKETENVLGGNAREEETEKEKEKETEKEKEEETEKEKEKETKKEKEEETEKEREEEEEETIVDEGEEETDIDDEASIANTEEEDEEEEAAAKRRKKRKNDNAPSQSVEDEMPEDEFDSCEVEILKLRSEIPPLKYKTFLDDNETFNKKITVRSSLGLAGMGEFRKLLQDEGLENKFRSSPFGHFLDLPERPLFQASIVHSLLLRRVFCEKTQELWFDYKRLPVCFGLREFAIMTGLNCGHAYTKSKLQKYLLDGDELWKLIARGKRSVTGKSIFQLIKSESDKIKKYKICLIWFVHGILLAKDSKCGVSETTVRLASTEEAFYNYPWGRNCFRLTVDYLMKDMKERQQSKGDSYNLYGFPWAFMAWAFEAIPQLRPKDYPKERTLPRMKRWLFEKLEKDRPDPFHIKDRPVVHPFLYPTKDEKMEPYIQNLVILSDKEDMMIDNLSKELDGVTVLRHLGGALKIEKGSLQTPQVGNSHVVGGYDDRIEKSIGVDGKMGGEAVDDDDGDGGMHFNDDNGRGEGSNYDDGRGAASMEKKGEIKDRIVAGTSSIHCPCICPDCLEKEKKQIKWRDDMQCQLNSMQKTMDDLVQKLSK